MQRYVLVARFLAGALLCNALPHLIQSLSGQPFQTPFAGGGTSSPLINVLWGTANLTIGGFLLSAGSFQPGRNRQTLLMWTGFVGTAISLALVFGSA